MLRHILAGVDLIALNINLWSKQAVNNSHAIFRLYDAIIDFDFLNS